MKFKTSKPFAPFYILPDREKPSRPLMASASRASVLRKISSSSSSETGSRRPLLFRSFGAKASPMKPSAAALETDDVEVPTEGISRPLSEILRELGKKVPESFVKARVEDGQTTRYVPWHIVNRILNMHAPEWSGEVRNIGYSADGKSVTVIYRVTLHGTDAEIYRESSGTASLDNTNYGDPVQKAEAMAFRRACARLGLGLHLYHEEL